MNKKELKKLIKPIVEECINEVLLQEGVLSSVISEVIKGTSVITEAPSRQERVMESAKRVNHDHSAAMARLQDQKQRASQDRKTLLDAIGNEAYNGVNLFEGTEPLQNNGPTPGHVDMGNPTDAGVDISSILGNASQVWKAIK